MMKKVLGLVSGFSGLKGFNTDKILLPFWIATLPTGVRDDMRGCILSMGSYLLQEKREQEKLLNALKDYGVL
jgi:hypothetical protein